MDKDGTVRFWGGVVDSCKLIFLNAPYLARISIVPIIAFLLMDWVAITGRVSFLSQNPDVFLKPSIPSFVLFLTEILGFIKFLCFVPVAVRWHKFILIGQKEVHFFPRLGEMEWRYLRLALALGAIYLIFFILVVLLSISLLEIPSIYKMKLPILTPILIQIIGLGLLGPFCLTLPALTIGHPISFIECWKMKHWDKIKIFSIISLLTLPTVILYVSFMAYNYIRIIASISESSEVLGKLINNIMYEGILISAPLTITTIFVFLTSISVIYKHFIRCFELHD